MRTSRFSKKKTTGGCCGIIALIFFIALVASIFNGHSNASPGASSNTDPSINVNATATDVSYQQTAVAVSNSWMTEVPTDTPVAQHTLTPTPKPQPTHQATPKPTSKPTQPPACQAVNGNPWCYNFSPGNLITNPPGNFCSYFNCIASFVSADDPDGGYVVECSDTTFSQSGGESGSCSHHGGNMRPLYSH